MFCPVEIIAAAMATLTSPETNDAVYDLSISCVPNAVILYNPYFKCEASLSPPNFVVDGLPPMITFLGSEDPAITVESIVAFNDDLKAHGSHSSAANRFYGSGRPRRRMPKSGRTWGFVTDSGSF